MSKLRPGDSPEIESSGSEARPLSTPQWIKSLDLNLGIPGVIEQLWGRRQQGGLSVSSQCRPGYQKPLGVSLQPPRLCLAHARMPVASGSSHPPAWLQTQLPTLAPSTGRCFLHFSSNDAVMD
ncbi:hypothetical protein HJG60_011877 [Phyllostomus discolor]|uniref:Uncharacterized protein n=1 Tax=Phyllostomus discolor TaxID=89673 RepID=A0A833ZD30_9CHIR|nr:hypothetical protein HJG60_011877 [Phyllostomus discolor]